MLDTHHCCIFFAGKNKHENTFVCVHTFLYFLLHNSGHLLYYWSCELEVNPWNIDGKYNFTIFTGLSSLGLLTWMSESKSNFQIHSNEILKVFQGAPSSQLILEINIWQIKHNRPELDTTVLLWAQWLKWSTVYVK